MSENKKPLSIKVKPPKSSALNKPVIMIIASVVVLGLLWVFLFGFNPSNNRMRSGQTKVSPSSSVDSQVQKLPGSYTDAKGIAAYLNTAPKIPKEVQDELARLKASQQALQKQLASLRNRPAQQTQPERTTPVETTNTANLSQAERSEIFFIGQSPKRESAANMGEASKAAAAAAAKAGEKAFSPYAAQNMQDEKLSFLSGGDKPEDIYNPHPLVRPASPYEVQAGTIIPAVLITAVNTSLPGMAVAQVSQDVYNTVDGRYLMIPKGTKAICEYNSKVAYGEERILLACQRLVFPNGDSIQLNKFAAADFSGASGLKGNVDNHWLRILGAATLSSILSIGTGIAGDGYSSSSSQFIPTAPQAALYGVAGSISSTGQTLTNRAINIQPTLTVSPGFEFNIIVNKDMVLKPYKYSTHESVS
ncbi:MAG: TrbI/VirB10 family protein [Pseudomonadota bacterium]